MLNIACNNKSRTVLLYPGQFCATVHCKEVKQERKYLNLTYGIRTGVSYSELRLHQS